MSKTKLAILVFVLAFGVNIFAFMFSKKAFLIEEVKNVWLYELPLTASPLDSYVAVELGPQNGVIGTLAHLKEKSDFKAGAKGTPSVLTIDLLPGLTFSSHEAILPEHWMKSKEWSKPYLQKWSADPLWNAYLTAEVEWKSPTQVQFSWKTLPANFDADAFMKQVLTHPMTGVIHPANLAAMALPKAQQEKKLTGGWISSGSYRVRKWNPKEITLINRDDFPITMAKEFFRTLKYQSAPVKNPACHFSQAMPGEEKEDKDLKSNPVDQTLHVFWICRSYLQNGSFCANEENRQSFANLISGQEARNKLSLASQKVRYRIPFGSNAFRSEIIDKINKDVAMMGGTTEEISYFFKPSTDADIELLFVVADSRIKKEEAAQMALLSSRLDVRTAEAPKNLVGEYAAYPIQILMKNMKGDAFTKVFIEPDLEEKKIPE